jgi:hypothetical protein
MSVNNPSLKGVACGKLQALVDYPKRFGRSVGQECIGTPWRLL